MAGKESGLSILRKQIKDNDLGNLYLLYGDEDYLKTDYERLLVKSFGPDPMDGFNRTMLEGGQYGADVLGNLIDEYPMMADKKIIRLHDTGFLKKTTADMTEFFKKQLADIPSYTVLIFTEKEVDKRSTVYKAVSKYGLCVQCDFLNENELVTWVARYVQEAKKKIDKKDALYLVNMCDEGLNNLKNELDKLLSFCYKEIQRCDIDSVVSKSLNTQVFEMTDGIMQKDADKVLTILNDLKTIREPAFKIMYLLFSTFDKMLHSKLLLDNGASYGEIASKIGVSPYIAQKYAKSAGGFSTSFLTDRVGQIADMDYSIKQGEIDDWSALEKYITESINQR